MRELSARSRPAAAWPAVEGGARVGALLQRAQWYVTRPPRAGGGRLRIIAFLTDVRVVRRILDHLRIPPVVAPRPRPPPDDYLPGIDRTVYDPCVDPPAAD